MPLITTSTFTPPFYIRSGHLQSILPSLVRRVPSVSYSRERITTPDGDFLDLDWSRAGSTPFDNNSAESRTASISSHAESHTASIASHAHPAESRVGSQQSRAKSTQLVIISHGLEGSSARGYVRGMVRAVNRAGWDALAWNYRGCSGETNRLLRSYHSGASDDLEVVIDHVASLKQYDSIALIGFSLGGNITLKYLGEHGDDVHPLVRAAVAFSVPCDLASSAHRLAERANSIYMRRFMSTLREKIRAKAHLLPKHISLDGIDRMRTFLEFDDRYTAPIHGYRDGPDYWTRASSRPLLDRIRRPTLLVSALDDPFLTPQCFPTDEASRSEWLTLETPSHGGHCGFMQGGGDYWAEQRAIEFLTDGD